MGVCNSTPTSTDASSLSASSLVPPDNLFSLTLIGITGVGKSTFYKQTRLNYSTFLASELEKERTMILTSIVSWFVEIIWVVRIMQGFSREDSDIEVLANKILPPNNGYIDAKIELLNKADFVCLMKKFWKSQTRRYIQTLRDFQHIPDNFDYFMNDLDRFLSPDYIPTERDYLYSYVRSAGVNEQRFSFEGFNGYIVDWSCGNRAERQKWARICTNAFMYVFSLSDFDTPMYEDNTESMLSDGLRVFRSIVRLAVKVLSRVPFVLILNKEDRLRHKLKQMEKNGVSLDEHFPELQMGNDYTNAYEKVREAIKNKFLNLCTEEERRHILVYFVSATDTESFKLCFKSLLVEVSTRLVQKIDV